MGRAKDEQMWRHYGDPQGLFRLEIPASWSVQRMEGKLTHGQQGRVWEGEHTLTTLHAPASRGDRAEQRHLGVSIRIERYMEAPPVLKGSPDPTDVDFFRRYRLSQDGDRLRCVVGHLRVTIQYELQALSHAYHSADWEPPAHHRFVRVAGDILSMTGTAAWRLEASAATTCSPACALSCRNGL